MRLRGNANSFPVLSVEVILAIPDFSLHSNGQVMRFRSTRNNAHGA